MKTVYKPKDIDKLEYLIEEVITKHNPIIIDSDEIGRVIVISEEDFRSYEETAYLLKSIPNAIRLLESIEELSQGKGVKYEPLE